jgi:hypothetical protein
MRAAPVHGTIILSPALYHAIQLAIIVYWWKIAEAKKSMKSTKNLCLFFTTCRCRDPLWISGHWTDSLQMIIGGVNLWIRHAAFSFRALNPLTPSGGSRPDSAVT